MTKTEFTKLVEEVLNDFGCTTELLKFIDEGICKVFYEGITELVAGNFFVAYRFTNRSKLRLMIMNELKLLAPADTEIL